MSIKIKDAPKSEWLLSKLRSVLSELPPGGKLPSEKDLTERFKFSRKTVRRSLDKLRGEKKIYSIPGKGVYKAKESSATSTNAIVLALNSVNLYNLGTIQGVANEAKKHNFKLLIHESGQDESDIPFLNSLTNLDSLRGIIIAPPPSYTIFKKLYKAYAILQNKGIAIVMINAPFKNLEFDNVGFDDYSAVKSITRFSFSMGHHKTAFVTFADKSSRDEQRLSGYLSAFSNSSLSSGPVLQFQGTPESSGANYIFEPDPIKLIRNDKITAFIASNDFLAAQLWKLLDVNRIKVPEDVMLTGLDTIPHVEYGLPFELTSCARPRALLGQSAFNLLRNRLLACEGFKFDPTQVLLPTEFIHGNSSAPAKISHVIP